MKTLVQFIISGEDEFFFELSGDRRVLDNVYINTNSKHSDKLNEIVYDEEGNIKVQKLKQPTKDWDFFVTCGIIP